MGDTTHTPYRSERQWLKKSRELFSKRELCTQAGSISAGKFLKQTSLGKILHFSKLKKYAKRYCKYLRGDLRLQRLYGSHLQYFQASVFICKMGMVESSF